MFQTIAARLGLVASHRPPPAPLAIEADKTDDRDFAGFETFGRTGLDIGGLHRDQQWVGAWGGRC
ncbi:hypothetical protein ACELLULO517_18950 [Acidisoma cellulosilytica]|uniref:Uncharacterized protein n=1 Tax=Acidisoma cellulosilyticum TaxID=2802395 RepID=A0A963Z3V9_9PROT|nr:hypothetical protein [Acidisoma cellulosilyticum]MCB8882334.1 hypothetical protein [Acidisoma cellulosilyticum]